MVVVLRVTLASLLVLSLLPSNARPLGVARRSRRAHAGNVTGRRAFVSARADARRRCTVAAHERALEVYPPLRGIFLARIRCGFALNLDFGGLVAAQFFTLRGSPAIRVKLLEKGPFQRGGCYLLRKLGARSDIAAVRHSDELVMRRIRAFARVHRPAADFAVRRMPIVGRDLLRG